MDFSIESYFDDLEKETVLPLDQIHIPTDEELFCPHQADVDMLLTRNELIKKAYEAIEQYKAIEEPQQCHLDTLSVRLSMAGFQNESISADQVDRIQEIISAEGFDILGKIKGTFNKVFRPLTSMVDTCKELDKAAKDLRGATIGEDKDVTVDAGIGIGGKVTMKGCSALISGYDKFNAARDTNLASAMRAIVADPRGTNAATEISKFFAYAAEKDGNRYLSFAAKSNQFIAVETKDDGNGVKKIRIVEKDGDLEGDVASLNEVSTVMNQLIKSIQTHMKSTKSLPKFSDEVNDAINNDVPYAVDHFLALFTIANMSTSMYMRTAKATIAYAKSSLGKYKKAN